MATDDNKQAEGLIEEEAVQEQAEVPVGTLHTEVVEVEEPEEVDKAIMRNRFLINQLMKMVRKAVILQ